jgi:hypothetical protein
VLLLPLRLLLLSLLPREDDPGQEKELPFFNPGLLPTFLPLSPRCNVWALAALRMNAQRAYTREVKAVITSKHLKDQPGPGTCSNTVLVPHARKCATASSSDRSRLSFTAASALQSPSAYSTTDWSSCRYSS